MKTHSSGDDFSSDETPLDSRAERTDKPNKIGFPFFNRTRAMGARGLEASALGWVLVGCTAFGFFVGTGIDKYFGSTMGMPIGVLIGIAAGFREMFVTIGAISRREKIEREATRKSNIALQNQPQSTAEAVHRTQSTAAPLQSTAEQSESPNSVAPQAERERIFKVPPPPLSSFVGGNAAQSTAERDETSNTPGLSPEELIARLSQPEEPNDADSNRNTP